MTLDYSNHKGRESAVSTLRNVMQPSAQKFLYVDTTCI